MMRFEGLFVSDAPTAKIRRTRSVGRRFKKAVTGLLMWIAVRTLPYVYMAYIWFVFRTSRVKEVGCTPAVTVENAGQGIYAIWHDEVLMVAWAFRKYRPHTMASRGDSGELITRILELCNHTVFRGGSSSSRRRQTSHVVREMVRHIKRHKGIVGITTDGSTGPVYRMKEGVISIALACRSAMFVQKTWCRRYFCLPTWDRTLVPLPFNRIVHVYAGPYTPPRDVREPKVYKAYVEHVEGQLCLVSAYARRMVEGLPPPADWLAKFPARWQAQMAKGEKPVLIHPFKPVIVDRHVRAREPATEDQGKENATE